MNYLERFKARQALVAEAYAGRPAPPRDSAASILPSRPVNVELELLPVVNQLVDLMIACKTKGIEFGPLYETAANWTEYEWQMVEPVVQAARQARAAA